MVDILYDAKNPKKFELTYPPRDYIPQRFFEEFPEHTELAFFKALFSKEEGLRFCASFTRIFSTDYTYLLNGIPFTLELDEDYDLITFSVEENSSRSTVARYLKKCIERGREALGA